VWAVALFLGERAQAVGRASARSRCEHRDLGWQCGGLSRTVRKGVLLTVARNSECCWYLSGLPFLSFSLASPISILRPEIQKANGALVGTGLAGGKNVFALGKTDIRFQLVNNLARDRPTQIVARSGARRGHTALRPRIFLGRKLKTKKLNISVIQNFRGLSKTLSSLQGDRQIQPASLFLDRGGFLKFFLQFLGNP